MLLERFCAESDTDERSHGVYLDTSSASTLGLYYRNGLELRGDGMLGDTHLWCLFRPTPKRGV
jgi:hypothetical protein